MKVGYYEFEGEDRYPEEEDTPVKPKRLKLKYKPRDFKEALHLKRLEEGDDQLIRRSLMQNSPARVSCVTTVKCR